MRKHGHTGASSTGRAKGVKAPPPLEPVVVLDAPEIHFDDDLFSSLESSGGVALLPQHRHSLEALGRGWCLDELVRQSARPNEFRALLQKAIRSLTQAAQKADLNPPNASAVQLQFVNWVINSPVEGASSLADELDDLIGRI